MGKKLDLILIGFIAILALTLLSFALFSLYKSIAAFDDCKDRGIPLIKCDPKTYDIQFDSKHLKEIGK